MSLFARALPNLHWLPHRASFNFSALLSPKRSAVLEAVLIGLVAAVASVLLKLGAIALGHVRLDHSAELPWILVGVGVGGGYLAGLLVERIAPEAAGSGIPQVKAALAYVPVSLDLRVAIVKFVSTLLILGGGFAMGRQGPTVQLGAALAAQLSRWVPASPDHQRQLIACGAAAGLAAGFDAPIAGVMFVIEELLQDVSSLTLGTAILASFTGGTVARVLAGPNMRFGFTPGQHVMQFGVADIPFLLILGVINGVGAALLSRAIATGVSRTRRSLPLSLPVKIALVGMISGLTTSLVPPLFRDSSSIQVVLTGGAVNWVTASAVFGLQFGLTVLACCVETPGGLFVPSLILGAALGQLVGLGATASMGGDPITYALVGMGAFFGAFGKVPITAIVILFEVTTSFKLILPLMLSVVTAYLVAEKLSPGSLHTTLLKGKGIHLDTPTPNNLWTRLQAKQVMQPQVESLEASLPLEDALQAFALSHHRGFPVLDQGKLVGIITQSDLDKHLGRGEAPEACDLKVPIREMMTPRPLTVRPQDSLQQVLSLFSRYKVSRLPVTEHQRLLGIITRSDILRVEAKQLEAARSQPRSQPSYCIYQTRSPATGTGRLLLPLSNPYTAPILLQLGFSLARSRNLELECLQFLTVPRHIAPSRAQVDADLSQQMMQQVLDQGKALGVPVHTQIRVGHSVAQGIVETVGDRQISCILMGWKGETSTPGRIFGDVVDNTIKQTRCELVLIKFGEEILQVTAGQVGDRPEESLYAPYLQHWLVPVAGGPNSRYALNMIPHLTQDVAEPKVQLCQVIDPETTLIPLSLPSDLVSAPPTYLRGDSVSQAVINHAQKIQCDVIMLGATQAGLVQQVLEENIPEAIAKGSDRTVILVRKAMPD
jgi:chloride channel protein, CIC family